jgi:hypothetical protein
MPLALIVVALAGLAVFCSRGVSDPDLWWHLRLGYDFLDQGSLAAPAHWSTFATAHWVPTEPLPEIVAAKADQWQGLNGVAWVYGLACLAVLVAVYLGNRILGEPLPAAVAAILAIMGCTLSLTPRPQLVSFALLPVVLWAWHRTRQDGEPRWWLVPMTYGWSLCHGFWFIGVAYGVLMIIGLALDRDVTRKRAALLLAVPVLSAASVLLNPVGLGVFDAPFAVNDVTQYVNEWKRTQFNLLAPQIVAAVLVLIVVLWLAFDRRWSWRRFLLFASSAFWLWYALRTVSVAGLVAAPLLTEALQTALRRPVPTGDEADRGRRLELKVLGAWVAVCLVALAVALPHTARQQPTNSALDRQLDQLPAGTTVFNSYELGGWLVWRHPDLNQVIDGLVTPYPASYVASYMHAIEADPGWQRFVAQTGAKVAVLRRSSPLVAPLEREGWRPTAREVAFVLLRAPGS